MMGPPRPVRMTVIAAVHGMAFVLQGLLLARLLGLEDSAAVRWTVAFAVTGILAAGLWRWWTSMPHWLDMSFGMAGVGTLGMYFGIWSDHHFDMLADLDSRFWTYGCMLAACNLSMLFLTHHVHHHRLTEAGFLSMMIGGSGGMVVGMLLGKHVDILLPALPRPDELLCRLLGMSLGMIVGMLLGYVIMLRLCRIRRPV